MEILKSSSPSPESNSITMTRRVHHANNREWKSMFTSVLRGFVASRRTRSLERKWSEASTRFASPSRARGKININFWQRLDTLHARLFRSSYIPIHHGNLLQRCNIATILLKNCNVAAISLQWSLGISPIRNPIRPSLSLHFVDAPPSVPE